MEYRAPALSTFSYPHPHVGIKRKILPFWKDLKWKCDQNDECLSVYIIVNANYNTELTALHYIYCKVYVDFVSEFSLAPGVLTCLISDASTTCLKICAPALSMKCTLFYLQCQSIINVIFLTTAGVLRLSIPWKESKIS